MNPEDKWNEFLEDIGNKVSKLIIPQPGDDPVISQRNFEVFREKVQAFGERWRRHHNAVERRKQWGVRLWRRAKADPRLQDSPSGTDAPKKNWWWDSHYFFDGLPFLAGPWHEMPAKYVPKVVRGAWKAMMAAIMKNPGAVEDEIPEMLETVGYIRSEYKRLKPAQRKREWVRTDPQTVAFDTEGAATVTPDRPARRFPWWRYMGWDDERAVGCWRPPTKAIENPCEWLNAETEQTYVHPHVVVKGLPELDDERELERQYVVLASIYDNRRRGGKRITAVWRKNLCDCVWDRLFKCREYGPSQGYIEDAIGYVRTDLERRNGMTGEASPPDSKSVHIDLRQWKKGGVRSLMLDFLQEPEPVTISLRRHKAEDATELRRALRRRDLGQVADAIQQVEGKAHTYRLNLPGVKITYDRPGT